PPLLMLVNHQSAAFLSDQVERQLQLRTAIASQTMENVPSEALRMDSHERRIARFAEIPHFQNYTFLDLVTVHSLETVHAEMPESTGEIGFGDLGQHGISASFHYNDRQALDGTTNPRAGAAAHGCRRVASQHSFTLRRLPKNVDARGAHFDAARPAGPQLLGP